MPWLPILLASAAFGREVVLRNDEAWYDRFGEDDPVVWLEYPECAVAVLTPDPEDYPLRVDQILVFLGSSLGNQDREITLLTLAMHVLDEGEDPRIMGYSEWDWPETAFYVTVSSEYFNGLDLDDPASGIYPLTLDQGRLAVFVCAPDPSWEYVWPCVTEGEDCSGLVVEGSSPGEGSWIVSGSEVVPLAEVGVEGAWVIRAVGEGPELDDTGAPADTGEPATLDLQKVRPRRAPQGQAALLTLTGSGFAEGVKATIGGLDVGGLVRVSGETLEGRSPSALPAGEHVVVAINPDGTSDLLPGGFHVIAPRPRTWCGCASGGPAALGLVLFAPLWLRRRRTARSVAG
jgi:MYXO-CTERM domain-containing protein